MILFGLYAQEGISGQSAQNLIHRMLPNIISSFVFSLKFFKIRM